MMIERTSARGGSIFPPAGMIVRAREPPNFGTQFGSRDGLITPVERFFVRGHFPLPHIDLAIAQPFNGCYQTIDYVYWERGPNSATLVPITDMRVNTQIARPGLADAVRASKIYLVCGSASERRPQPVERDLDRRSYIVNHLPPIEVDVV